MAYVESRIADIADDVVSVTIPAIPPRKKDIHFKLFLFKPNSNTMKIMSDYSKNPYSITVRDGKATVWYANGRIVEFEGLDIAQVHFSDTLKTFMFWVNDGVKFEWYLTRDVVTDFLTAVGRTDLFGGLYTI